LELFIYTLTGRESFEDHKHSQSPAQQNKSYMFLRLKLSTTRYTCKEQSINGIRNSAVKGFGVFPLRTRGFFRCGLTNFLLQNFLVFFFSFKFMVSARARRVGALRICWWQGGSNFMRTSFMDGP